MNPGASQPYTWAWTHAGDVGQFMLMVLGPEGELMVACWICKQSLQDRSALRRHDMEAHLSQCTRCGARHSGKCNTQPKSVHDHGKVRRTHRIGLPSSLVADPGDAGIDGCGPGNPGKSRAFLLPIPGTTATRVDRREQMNQNRESKARQNKRTSDTSRPPANPSPARLQQIPGPPRHPTA